MNTVIMKKSLILVPAFVLLVGVAHAQEHASRLDTLVKKFRQYREQSLQEKIYGHIDRTFYITGETLWFKIYAVDGTLHRPLDLSKVAYAEVVDKANFPVLQAKIALRNGQGHGSFFLPASLMSGHYKLRIYTSWMKNFPAEFFFDEVFTLVNPFVASNQRGKKPAPAYSVDLFPEGGNLVSGIRSKLGFRILDSQGTGANIRGWVLNDKNDTVASFAPTRSGIGHFFLMPSVAERYRVALDHETKAATTFSFPVVHPAGYVMQVTDSAESVRVTVMAGGVAAENIYLFAHARHSIVHAETKFHHGKTIFEIPKNKMAEGITHFTLFNNRFQPLCERLYFIFPEKRLDIEISTNQKVYSPRKKVFVSLKSKADEGLIANMSMSVYKIDSLSRREGTHIHPYLWLSSDLTGRIEAPDYYFNNRGPAVNAAMDNLMLTHGWRRFEWKNIFTDNSPFEFLPEVSDHIMTITVKDQGQERRGIFTYMASPGKSVRVYGAWTDNDGQLRFQVKDFHGPRRIILQTRGDTTEAYTINVHDPFSSTRDEDTLPPLHLDPALEENIVSRSIAMQVQDIFAHEYGDKTAASPIVDSSAFYGKGDATYYLDDYTRFPVMEEVMREYVPEVFVRKRKDGFHFIVAQAGAAAGVLPGDPMVLLDGVPILDVDDIMRMDPLRVKKLEVVKHMYHLGQASLPGIVSYTTYEGDLGGMELDPQSLSLNYEGLQLKREFFKPGYSREDIDKRRIPDQRHLLHWESDIVTDQHGDAVVEFSTSDVTGRYRIVVEGLNHKGYAGTQTYEFTVNSPDTQ